MNEILIAYMDSGLGGLPYMESIRKERPEWQHVYMADHEWFPYGEKNQDQLRQRILHICGQMIDHYNPDVFVLACNTASVLALDELRSKYKTPFVGVVPAVKPAAELTHSETITILATENTVKGTYLQSLIQEFAPSQPVRTIAASDLVSFVEDKLIHADEADIIAVIEPYIRKAVEENWKIVVLGCTHFILLKDWFRKLLPSHIQIIDSTDGVTRRVLSLCGQAKGKVVPRGKENIFHISASRGKEDYYQSLAEAYDLHYSPMEGGRL